MGEFKGWICHTHILIHMRVRVGFDYVYLWGLYIKIIGQAYFFLFDVIHF